MPDENASPRPSDWKPVGQGALMGTADVIPGVSGGTVALVLGIYPRLVDAIKSVDHRLAIAAWHALTRGAEGRQEFGRAWARADATFLLRLVLGIGTGILLAARPLGWALEHHPTPMLALFFGLVLGSLIVPWRLIRRHRAVTLVLAAAGTALAFWLTGTATVTAPQQDWFLPVAGAIAITAMILPGISGAYLLVILGLYDRLLEALNSADVVPLLLFAGGAVVGILAFARVLSFLLHRFPDPTLAALTGLMLGSLRRVWPFKEGGGKGFASGSNVLPDPMSSLTWGAVAAFLVGVALVTWLDRRARASAPQASRASQDG